MRERPIIFVSGCFDIIHPGHIRFLKAAKEQGKTLVVGLNSDVSVQALKGRPPYLPEQARRETLLAIRYVDEVILFDEVKPWKLVSEIDPYVWYRGPDHKTNAIGPEREEPYFSSELFKNIVTSQSVQLVEKVWGQEAIIVNEEKYCAKILRINPGFACSLHFHMLKTETFIGVSGMWKLEHGPVNIARRLFRMMGVGDHQTILPSTPHRFSSREGAMVLEVSTHHDDADVTRLEPSAELPHEATAHELVGKYA